MSDWLFWIDVLRNGPMGYLDEVLAKYRLHSENVSKRHDAMLADQLLALGIIESKYPEYIVHTRRLRAEILWGHGVAALKAGEYELANMYFDASYPQAVRDARTFPMPFRLGVYIAVRSGVLKPMSRLLRAIGNRG